MIQMNKEDCVLVVFVRYRQAGPLYFFFIFFYDRGQLFFQKVKKQHHW